MKTPGITAVLLAILSAACYSSASTLVVTKIEDTNDGVCDADCSLREAVAAAAADDTVVFSSLFNTPQTIILTLGQIAIPRNLTITGTSRDLLTISGNNASRIFRITGGSTVNVSEMRLTDALASAVGDAIGGGIYQTGGSLTLTNMSVVNNTAQRSGQNPSGAGGGICVDTGTLVIVDSTISSNIVPPFPGGAGGGIYAVFSDVRVTNSAVNFNSREGIQGSGTGAQQNVVTVNNSILSGNTGSAILNGSGRTTVVGTVISNNGGGIGGGDGVSTLAIDRSVISDNHPYGGVGSSGMTVISNSVISNNANDQFGGIGGGIGNIGTLYILSTSIINDRAFDSGGGIYNVLGHTYLTNSTVSGNFVSNGAGNSPCPGGGIANIWNQTNPGGTVVLTNSTIANNTAQGRGGGICNQTGGTVITRNSIIAQNTGTAAADFSGVASSDGNNLIGNTAGNSGWIASDFQNVDPLLAPLGNNGGSTWTHALLRSSPAINAGNNGLARDPYDNSPLIYDQRGSAFPRTVNGNVDIGAYEANYATGLVTVSGRVLTTPIGRGISKAYITFTDPLGNVRYTQTNPFGYYRFQDLVPGTTYTIRILHKSYSFDSPQYVTIDQNRNDLNFIARRVMSRSVSMFTPVKNDEGGNQVKTNAVIARCAIAMSISICVGCNQTPVGKHETASSIERNDVASADDRKKEPEATNWREAQEWRMSAWRDQNGNIIGGLSEALEQRDAYLHANLDENGFGDIPISHLTWISRGPGNVGGRTRSMIVHPTDSNILWAGSLGGGVWKSFDRGETWHATNGDLGNFAVSCLTLDTNVHQNEPPYQTLYAGTGEGGGGGGGIFRSTDAGITWSLFPGTDPRLPNNAHWATVNRISVQPGNSDVILASNLAGIYRYDGNAWTRVVNGRNLGSRFVSFDPTNGSYAVGEVMSDPSEIPTAVYSRDGGAAGTWHTATRKANPQATPLPFQVPGGDRIELGYKRNQTDIVYALNKENGATSEVSRSTDGGQSFLRMDTTVIPGPDPTPIPINANTHNESVWVSPDDQNAMTVVVGGNHIYKSTDGGDTFLRISAGYLFDIEQPHIDQHCLTQDPQNSQRVYACTDGGIWRAENILSANVSDGWENKNKTYRTAEYYAAKGHGGTGLIYGGTQDNGTIRSTSSGQFGIWSFGGDGGITAIDTRPTPMPTNCYGEYIFLQINRGNCSDTSGAHPIFCGAGTDAWCLNGFGTDPLLDALHGDAGANFIAPFAVDPTNPTWIIAGGVSIWRSKNADQEPQPSWFCIRGPNGGACPIPNPSGTPTPTPSGPKATAIAIAPYNPDVIWVGYAGGTMVKTATGTKQTPTWSTVTPLPNIGNLDIQRILIDPASTNIVFVARGAGPDNLFKTTDGGGTWMEITGPIPSQGGLPEVPVRGIARHPDYSNKLYVGTELGLYSTVNGGDSWQLELQGPAKVPVGEVTFMQGTTTLLAACYGRGVWTAETSPPVNVQHSLYDFDGDGKADTAVFRPSTGVWHLNGSWDGYETRTLGLAGDIPSAADYDGDGKTDVCVFRPSNGTWYWIKSSDGTTQSLPYGQNHDVAVPGDFDHDGKADQAVFRADQVNQQGLWYVHLSGGGTLGGQWGIDTDWPIAADFNGDGYADFGVFRLKDGYWWLLESGNWRAIQWGLSGDIPVVADYDGDAAADVAVFRPLQNQNRGDWWIIPSAHPTTYQYSSFGYWNDIPVPADYDGDGKADIAVFRPSDGFWYLLGTTSGFEAVQWGANGDFPAPQHVFVQ